MSNDNNKENKEDKKKEEIKKKNEPDETIKPPIVVRIAESKETDDSQNPLFDNLKKTKK